VARIGSRIVVLVHIGAAEGDVARELLDGGLVPPSKGREVREGRTAVVVGIPQLHCGRLGAIVAASHNALPHVCRSVDGRHLSVGFNSVDEFHDVITVAIVVRSPATVGRLVGFDIEPDHAIERAGDVGHHLVDLRRGRFAPAGEHVDISDHASGLSVAQIVDHMDVHRSEGVPAPHDDIGITVVLHALVGGSGERLTDIHAQHAQRWHHHQQDREQPLH
jgi:hypothetical protein